MTEEIPPTSRSSLLQGSLVRPVLRLSFPTVLANILQSGFVLVDMWFVSRLGTGALAAVSVTGVVMSVILPLVIGLSVGANALISRAQGSGDREALTRAIFTVLVTCAIVAALLTTVGLALSGPVLHIFNLEPEVHRQALGYIRILFAGSLFMVSLFLVNAVLRALGDAITPFVVLVLSTLVNLGLDPLLIFGPGPFPRMGIDGAAVASVTARLVGLCVASVVLARRYLPRPIVSLTYFSRATLARVFRIGLPSSMSMMTRQLSGLIVTAIVGQFGTAALATYGVCQRITFLVLMPGFGFAIGAAVLVGQNLGAQKPRRAEMSSWIAVASYSFFVIASAILLFVAPRPIVGLFDPTPAVVQMGGDYFAVVAPALLMLPLGVVLSRAMSGAGYTFWPMVLTMTVLLGIRIPLAWILSARWQMDGIYWAVALPVAMEGLLMLILFLKGSWKRKKVS